MALKLNKATYNPKGYMTLAWSAGAIDRGAGYVVHIARDGGNRDFTVIDPLATSVILPFNETPGNATATLWGLDASYKPNPNIKSNTLAVGTAGSARAAPVDPMPTSPLSVGSAASISFDLQSLLPTMPKNVNWMAAPSANVRVDHGAARIVEGRAAFKVDVTRKLADGIASLLTVSVGDADKIDGDRVALLYKVVRPELIVSQNRSYAVASDPTYYPFDIGNKDQSIALTALVRDVDDGMPILNYQLGWEATMGNTPIVVYPDGSKPSASAGMFATETGPDGTVTLLFASTAPAILDMGIYWMNGTQERPHRLVYTSLGQSWETADFEAPDVPVPLNLDRYPDDQGVPVYLVNRREIWMVPGCFAAYWINGTMLPSERLGDDFLTKPARIPKQYFKTGGANNLLGVCIAEAAEGNGHDSRLADFFADGTIPAEKPHKPSGAFDAPYLPNHADLVNAPLIAGGLWIHVPASGSFGIGDTVTMTLYLDGYEPGTGDRKVATIHVSDSRVVQDPDRLDGFYLVVSEDLLADYGASIPGELPGVMLAQYTVLGRGAESYSAVGTFRLVTV